MALAYGDSTKMALLHTVIRRSGILRQLVVLALSLLAIVSLILIATPARAVSRPTSTASQSHDANPTCASYVGRWGTDTACVQAWANGVTFSWSYTGWYLPLGAVYDVVNQSVTTVGQLSCEGPDASTFVPLSAGTYSAGAQLTGAPSPSPVYARAILTVGGSLPPAPASTCNPPLPSAPAGCTGSDVGVAATPSTYGSPPDEGLFVAESDGQVCTDGNAGWYGDASGLRLNKGIVGIAATPDGRGYWLLGGDGGVFSYGDAQFYGSTGNLVLNAPAIGMASTPDGGGYWFVASDGGVFSYGDAAFYGSMGGRHLNRPVVGMAADLATGGYWLVASDGGVFSFNAPFYGSTGSLVLNQPITGMEAAPDGSGYRFVAADGGVFCFNQPFAGSAVGNPQVPSRFVGIVPFGTSGYTLLATNVGVTFGFGGSPFSSFL